MLTRKYDKTEIKKFDADPTCDARIHVRQRSAERATAHYNARKGQQSEQLPLDSTSWSS
jgi:hypothetical protein